jgi:hypothetical protein
VKIPTTSTTLLRDLAQDSQHARWGEFVARYRSMMEAYMRTHFPTVDADDGAKVRLENCLFNNRSKTLPSKSKIRYDLAGGVYLNFTGHEDDFKWRDCVELANGENNSVRFKGPETIEDYNCLRQKECAPDL